MNTLANRGIPRPTHTIVAPSVADAAALVGRILLAVIFIKSGWGKIGGFEQTAGMMATKGLPFPEVLLVVTILVEFGAGLLLAIGYKARWAALAFALWLIPSRWFSTSSGAFPPTRCRCSRSTSTRTSRSSAAC
jgi:putative oxidoreductase